MTGAGTALLLLAAVLGVACAGAWQLAVGRAERLLVVERTALDQVEARAARLRSRADIRLRRTQRGRRLADRLAGAGVGLGPLEFLFAASAVTAAGFVVANVLFPTFVAMLLAAAAARGCWAWVRRRQDQRRHEFVSQLPELARVLSNAAGAGLAIRTAIEMAAEELDDPASAELTRVVEAMRLGTPIEIALSDMEARMPSREVGVLVSTLVIQHRAGGKLVGALRAMADTLDARKDLRREIRTLMAGSIFTGYLVGVMGAGTLLLLNAISPGLLEEMTASAGGRIVMLIATVMYALGFALIRRITRIET